jgi:hypothetical protein
MQVHETYLNSKRYHNRTNSKKGNEKKNENKEREEKNRKKRIHPYIKRCVQTRAT